MDLHAPSSTNQERYDVFRRAVAGDAEALADVIAWYRPLLIAWARQKLANMPVEEPYADIADEAFARAWSALVASGLDTFPGLASVLGYLRSCVGSVVIDRARSQSSSTRIMMRMETSAPLSPEQIVLAELTSAEIWDRISLHATTEQERVVVYESMALELPPRLILQRHPGLFDDVATIYRIKRNLFERLRRDDDLRQLYGE
jgi:DNA-directed RNA polymerase specialized sigma24 family protein